MLKRVSAAAQLPAASYSDALKGATVGGAAHALLSFAPCVAVTCPRGQAVQTVFPDPLAYPPAKSAPLAMAPVPQVTTKARLRWCQVNMQRESTMYQMQAEQSSTRDFVRGSCDRC